MSSIFNFTNEMISTNEKMVKRAKYEVEAHLENNGLGDKMIKDVNFVERIHYGVIDNYNNSIIPKDQFMVPVVNSDGSTGRIFDFAADSLALMRLNFLAAVDKGLIIREGAAFAEIDLVSSYSNPRLDYESYLRKIFNFYNLDYIPNVIGSSNITSYEKYVNNFFNFVMKESLNVPITLTRYNTSTNSSILNTGLAFSFSDIDFDDDQQKVSQILRHPSYEFFKNLCLNMGFCILHNNPNILLFDVASPANAAVLFSNGILDLDSFFEERFIKTHTLDISLLYNNINIYYNQYAILNPLVKTISIECGKTVASYSQLSTVNNNINPHDEQKQLFYYCQIRNLEEGNPFSSQKVTNIYKKSIFLLKKLDISAATEYINNEFRDQVWNKPNGYDDLLKKQRGTTITQSEVSVRGGSSGASYSGGSGGGTTSGGSSSGY